MGRWLLRARGVVFVVVMVVGGAAAYGQGGGSRSVRDFGVSADKAPEANKGALQAAIDWASSVGGEVVVEAGDTPYRVQSGVVLKRNATLVGVHGPLGRGSRHAKDGHPVGSVFQIEDADAPFLTVESSTQVRGVQFYYPQQTVRDPKAIIEYPATIRVSQTGYVAGVTLRDLTFYGEYLAMDFNASAQHPCELILIEHCYGYPLGGEFVRIDRCYDVPRVLHCHVNPANRRLFAGDCAPAVVDAVIAKGTYAYTIDHTDNAVMMDVFTFGTFGGAKLGAASYGQLTSFNFDCVGVGIFKDGDQAFNRNWQVAQGSIIANAGKRVEDVHPIIVQGQGHLSLMNVEAFSGPNPALTVLGKSQDFILVRGEERVTVSMVGCRMRNYVAERPVTMENAKAAVSAAACFDRDEREYPAKP
jgi:hypothetical protein